MAIVHVAYKSSSAAPPAAAHAQYIARDGQYERRGGVELVESGNMPEFAQADPFAFWVAADAHERANGRTYTELQIALPRELDPAHRQELAREVTRELLGDRFAYMLAVHSPLAKDNIDQPHMHLMFSERVVDSNTQSLPEDRFFKRNGAKKDPEWNRRDKPEEVREKWVAMMNGAMERAGIEQKLDARSYLERGRVDLEELKEPKLLVGEGTEAKELRTQVDGLRQKRAELPAPHLDQAAAVQQIEREAERRIAAVEKRRDEELSILDKLIEKARELAAEVKDRTVAVVRDFAERVEAFFGGGKEGTLAESAPAKEPENARPPTPEETAQFDRLVSELDTQLESREALDKQLADLDRRMENDARVQQEKDRAQEKQQRSHTRNRGIERDGGHEL
jgi:hypothetical protein